MLHVNDMTLQTGFTNDEWNRVVFDSRDHEAPSQSRQMPRIHPEIYGDDGKRGPFATIHPGKYGLMHLPPARVAGPPDTRAHAPLLANREFGLYRVPVEQVILSEIAPNQSLYRHPRLGDIGRMMF